jgi:hypothetical protein
VIGACSASFRNRQLPSGVVLDRENANGADLEVLGRVRSNRLNQLGQKASHFSSGF